MSDVTSPLHETVEGYLASRPMKTTTTRRCPRCRGARTTESDAAMPCRVCDGAGTVETYTHEQVQAMLIARVGAELDAAIVKLDSLGVECGSLREENARLREALEQAIESVLDVEDAAASAVAHVSVWRQLVRR